MDKIIEIADIIPTHNTLRNYNSVLRFLHKLESGEKLDPIIVKELDDKKIYLHDGMHRLSAYWIHGVEYLDESQFILKHFTYEQFKSVNFAVGWVTPFDLKTECRKADLYNWKTQVAELDRCLIGNKTLVERAIRRHGDAYKEPRKVWTIEDVLKQRKEYEGIS